MYISVIHDNNIKIRLLREKMSISLFFLVLCAFFLVVFSWIIKKNNSLNLYKTRLYILNKA